LGRIQIEFLPPDEPRLLTLFGDRVEEPPEDVQAIVVRVRVKLE